MRIAQASEASRLSNPAPTAAAASAAHDSRSPSTSFASRDQSNSVNSSTPNRESQSSSRSSNTRSKQPANSNSSKQFAKSSSRDNSSTPDRSTPHDPPPYSSPTDVMAASQSSQSNRSSSKLNAISTVCFKCGKPGHISSTCTFEGKLPRHCYACSGIGHFSRDCPSRSYQQHAQPAESKPESTGAVSSAGTRVAQLISEELIDGEVLICDALVDTGSAYSMVSSALYDRLPTLPAIYSFENSAPDIVGVGGANAEVRGYVVVPLLIAGFDVAHPLLVVSELPFAMLICMDVLRPHAASFSVCDSTSLQLHISVCAVCLERRAETKRESRKAPAVVCAVDTNRMPKLPLLPLPVSLSAPSSLLLPASSPPELPVLSSLPPTRSLPPLIHPPLPPPLRPPLIPLFASTFAPFVPQSCRSPFAPAAVARVVTVECRGTRDWPS